MALCHEIKKKINSADVRTVESLNPSEYQNILSAFFKNYFFTFKNNNQKNVKNLKRFQYLHNT